MDLNPRYCSAVITPGGCPQGANCPKRHDVCKCLCGIFVHGSKRNMQAHKGGKRHRKMLGKLIEQQEGQPGAMHSAAVSTFALFNFFPHRFWISLTACGSGKIWTLSTMQRECSSFQEHSPCWKACKRTASQRYTSSSRAGATRQRGNHRITYGRYQLRYRWGWRLRTKARNNYKGEWPKEESGCCPSELSHEIFRERRYTRRKVWHLCKWFSDSLALDFLFLLKETHDGSNAILIGDLLWYFIHHTQANTKILSNFFSSIRKTNVDSSLPEAYRRRLVPGRIMSALDRQAPTDGNNNLLHFNSTAHSTQASDLQSGRQRNGSSVCPNSSRRNI